MNGDRTADLVLAYLRKALNWWQTRDEDFVSPIVKGMGRYKAKDRERKRVLTDDELRIIWAKTETGEPFHALVRFLLLTGCRREEAAGLAFDEINSTTWTLPASRNKTKVDLVRPLSKPAAAIVDAQPRIGNSWRVFTYSGARMAFGARKKALAEACGIADWRLHDLRRTARTLMSRAGVELTLPSGVWAMSSSAPRCVRQARFRRRKATRFRGIGNADLAHRQSDRQRKVTAGVRGLT